MRDGRCMTGRARFPLDVRADVRTASSPTRPPDARAGLSVAVAVAADLAPPTGATARIRDALERAEGCFVARVVADGGIGSWRRQVLSRFRVARDLVTSSRVSRAETAALVVALLDHVVRDRCWEQVETGADARWLALWRHLARNAVTPYRVEPLFLFGWTAWRCGDGASARMAIGCALEDDQRHRASGMLDQMLCAGMDSRLLPSLAAGRRATGTTGDR